MTTQRTGRTRGGGGSLLWAPSGIALCARASRFQHDCRPNVVVVGMLSRRRLLVRVVGGPTPDAPRPSLQVFVDFVLSPLPAGATAANAAAAAAAGCGRRGLTFKVRTDVPHREWRSLKNESHRRGLTFKVRSDVPHREWRS